MSRIPILNRWPSTLKSSSSPSCFSREDSLVVIYFSPQGIMDYCLCKAVQLHIDSTLAFSLTVSRNFVHKHRSFGEFNFLARYDLCCVVCATRYVSCLCRPCKMTYRVLIQEAQLGLKFG